MTTIKNATLSLIPVEVNQMISKMKSALASYSADLQETITPISSYINENGLAGQAYVNSKNHMEDHISVLKGAIIANKELSLALDNLSSIVGTERLIEDEIIAHIEKCKDKISDYEEQISFYQELLRNSTYEALFGWHARYRIRCCRDMITSLEKIIRKLNEKLELLYSINEESTSCFESITGAYAYVLQGIRSLNEGRSIKGFKPRVDAEWRTNLNEIINKDNVDEIVNQLRHEYPELTEDDLSRFKEELIKETGTSTLEKALEKAGVLVVPLLTSTGKKLINIGSIPGPTGENSFIILSRTGVAGSNMLSGASNVGKCITVAGKAVPIVAAAIDFGTQVHGGESKTNAAIKTGAHLGISIGAAKLGAMIGTACVPGVGTAAGAAIGFVAGVAIAAFANVQFDKIYDDCVRDKVDLEVDKLLNSPNIMYSSVGNAQIGTFGGMGCAAFI